ncbi:MAG: acyl-[acyl-carrier-protein] thioesterase [Peptoniphilaceae bacterium]
MKVDDFLFSKQYEIYDFYCKNNRLRIDILVNLMIETSNEERYNHINSNKFMESNDYSWMVYNWKIKLYRAINLKEKIIIKTWASGFDKIRAFREFEIVSDRGQVLAVASGVFLIVDINKHRAIRIPDEVKKDYLINEKINFDRKKRLERIKEVYKIKEYNINNTDIDKNKHVNNSVYLRWIYDSIDSEFLKKNYIMELELTYSKEITNKNSISIYKSLDKTYIEFASNVVHAYAKINFSEIA